VNIEISDSPVQVPDLVDDILAEGGDILVMISDQRMPMKPATSSFLVFEGAFPTAETSYLPDSPTLTLSSGS
jgi:hypothetical protein